MLFGRSRARVKNMTPGVEVQDIVVGTGDEAVRGKTAIVNASFWLLDGTEVEGTRLSRYRIDLGRRDCIAGLRYGIEGMRAGGKRTLIISPHLAYGAQGVPNLVPPDATLRCEVELLDVRERGVVKPEDYPPGRQLIVGWLGDFANGIAKWQFGLHDDGRCGAMVWVPIPGLKWRHSRPKHVETKLTAERATALIENMTTLPQRYPKDCLSTDQVCVDHAGHDGGVHRDRQTDALCMAVSVWERGQFTSSYYIAEECAAWRESGICGVIRDLVAPAVEAERRSGARGGLPP